VLHAEVLMLPNGMSKGCGIVEYSTREEAQRAIQTLSNTTFMGRQIFIREDREQEPRFAAGHRGGHNAGGYGGYPRGGYVASASHGDTQGRQVFVGNVLNPPTRKTVSVLFVLFGG
jgi:RNA recognition motif-containing protein